MGDGSWLEEHLLETILIAIGTGAIAIGTFLLLYKGGEEYPTW